MPNSFLSCYFELETVVRNIGITSMTQWSQWPHWNAIYVAIHWQDCYGKEDWKRSCCKKVGTNTPVGNVFVFTDRLNFLSVYVHDTHMIWREASFALV